MAGVITVNRRIHQGWKELSKVEKLERIGGNFIGKYQYIFRKGDKIISLIFLRNYFHDGKNFWEMCSLKGESAFNDVERFNTHIEALERIKKVLGGGEFVIEKLEKGEGLDRFDIVEKEGVINENDFTKISRKTSGLCKRRIEA